MLARAGSRSRLLHSHLRAHLESLRLRFYLAGEPASADRADKWLDRGVSANRISIFLLSAAFPSMLETKGTATRVPAPDTRVNCSSSITDNCDLAERRESLAGRFSGDLKMIQRHVGDLRARARAHTHTHARARAHTHTRTRARARASRCRVKTTRLSFDLNSDHVANALNYRVALITLSFEPGSLAS